MTIPDSNPLPTPTPTLDFPVFETQPVSASRLPGQTPPTFTATVAAVSFVDHVPVLSLQWQQNTDGTWTDITDETTTEYTAPPMSVDVDGTQYRLQATYTYDIDGTPTTRVTTSTEVTYSNTWRTCRITSTRSHPVPDPAGTQQRLVTVVPGESDGVGSVGTAPYWGIDIDIPENTSPRGDVLAVRDGVVLLAGTHDVLLGSRLTGTATTGPAYIGIYYEHLHTVSAVTGTTVTAGDVLGVGSESGHLTIHVFRTTPAVEDPTESLAWATDPTRVLFPPDSLWTRRPFQAGT